MLYCVNRYFKDCQKKKVVDIFYTNKETAENYFSLCKNGKDTLSMTLYEIDIGYGFTKIEQIPFEKYKAIDDYDL
jgi:hypothetical protein